MKSPPSQPPRDYTAGGPKLRSPITDNSRPDRLRKGLCENCRNVQCYEIKRIVGLFPVKVALTKPGKVYNGICLECYPHRDPDRSVAGSTATLKQNNLNRSGAGGDAFQGEELTREVHRIDSNDEKIREQVAATPNYGTSHTREVHRIGSSEKTIEEQAANLPKYDTSHNPHSSRREVEDNINALSNEEKVEEQSAEDLSYDENFPPSSGREMGGNFNRDSLAQSNSSLDTDVPDALTKYVKDYHDQNPEAPMKFDPSNTNAEIHVQESLLVDDQSVVTLGSGFETIATRQKPQRSNLTPISESVSEQPAVAPHVAALPAQVINLRELVEQCIGAGLDDTAIDIIRGEIIRDNSGSKNIDLALYCFNTLWSLARKSDDNKRQIITGNTPSTYDAILEAMDVHIKSAELQAKGCGLMLSLSMVPNNRTHVASFGGCDAILKAMNWHTEVESLQAMAIRALKVLSFDSVGRRSLCTWGAPIIVADAMLMHTNNPSIQSEGSVILSNLAVDEENQTVLPVSEREIDAIIRGMIEHPDSLTVHEAA